MNKSKSHTILDFYLPKKIYFENRNICIRQSYTILEPMQQWNIIVIIAIFFEYKPNKFDVNIL